MLENAINSVHALVTDGVVVNLLLWDGEDLEFAAALLPSQLVAVPEGQTVAVGDGYDGAVFVPASAPVAPELPVPQSVTMRQARLALLAEGRLAEVEVAIGTLPSPQREAAQIEWEFAATVDRSSSIVQLLADALGLDAVELDTLFMEASRL